MQERRNSSALAMELRLSCTNPSMRILVPTDTWTNADSYAILHIVFANYALNSQPYHPGANELNLNINSYQSGDRYMDISQGQWTEW